MLRPSPYECLDGGRAVRSREAANAVYDRDVSAYLEGVLTRHQPKPNLIASLATTVVISSLRQWAAEWLNGISYIGSVPKGTAISETTDLDIFVSLKPNTPFTLQEIYENLFNWATNQHWAPRRQNVSIGINSLGAKIDVVPARQQQGFTYYHSLWKHKAQTWTQTAPAIHVNRVRDSGRAREIRMLKIWRKNQHLDFPSFYLELMVLEALSGCAWNLISLP